MRKTLLLFSFLSFFNLSYSQHLLEAGYMHGLGIGNLSKGISSSNGFILKYYYNIHKDDYFSPLHIGISYGYLQYGSTEKTYIHFYRDQYQHDVANVKNNHNCSYLGLNFRYQFYNSGHYFFPFFEFGGGLLNHYSNYIATNPFLEGDETDNSYKGRIITSRTFYTTFGIGLSVSILPDVAISISTHYQWGGNVRFKNTKYNPDHFRYNPGILPNSMIHPDQIIPDGDWYKIEEQVGVKEFNARHQMITSTVRLTMYF